MCYSDPCRRKRVDRCEEKHNHCGSCKKEHEDCRCYKHDKKHRKEFCHCCNRYY